MDVRVSSSKAAGAALAHAGHAAAARPAGSRARRVRLPGEAARRVSASACAAGGGVSSPAASPQSTAVIKKVRDRIVVSTMKSVGRGNGT